MSCLSSQLKKEKKHTNYELNKKWQRGWDWGTVVEAIALTLESHTGASSSPICSTFNSRPCQCGWESREEAQALGLLPPMMGTQTELWVPGFSLHTLQDWDSLGNEQQMEDLSLILCLSTKFFSLKKKSAY